MATTAPTRRLASIAATARYTGVSKTTIRRRLEDRTLSEIRFGPRTVRIDLDEVDRVFGLGDPS
ncbi:helix-turn-helix transcriptional regulator [Rhodococcus koreensis]|uniref:helix-turn-helix transcriptional regulator n=1 Tax=Rhodococcus koreensis TaxID=99653 RepID=UPI00198005B2|nr:excisionase family DNA-binding protein [Rhodococcus koreensis]QSE84077.1 excisionase family DNA-binding protein [Rhodococcus koreensis]